MLSNFLIVFLPRNIFFFFLISLLQSPSTVILEPKKIKPATVFIFFPIYLPWGDGTRCYNLSFLILSFKSVLSLSSFTFIKILFSSSSISAIRVVSSAYLRLLIFLLEILIPACDSFSPAFCRMLSACKLNKQGNNI